MRRLRAQLHPPPRRRARHRSCIGSPRARPTSRRWCGRSISASIRGCQAAGLSVLAHLEDLVARGVVRTDGPPSIAGIYRFAGLSLLAPCRRGGFLAGAGPLGGDCDRHRCPRAGRGCARHWRRRSCGRSARPSACRRASRRGVRTHAHDDVLAETHDRRARDRLDASFAAAGCGGRAYDHTPCALGDDGERGVIGRLRRHRRRFSGSMSG